MQSQGYRLHRPRVMGNILARSAIAARGSPNENAIFVQQAHSHAIELGFATERQNTQPKLIGIALLKRLKIVSTERIIKAQHRHLVTNASELIQRFIADSLGG